MKRELLIFIVIFFVLTFTIHYKEFLTHPLEQILNLPRAGAYGFGTYHPLLFSLILFIIILVPRTIIRLFRKSIK